MHFSKNNTRKQILRTRQPNLLLGTSQEHILQETKCLDLYLFRDSPCPKFTSRVVTIRQIPAIGEKRNANAYCKAWTRPISSAALCYPFFRTDLCAKQRHSCSPDTRWSPQTARMPPTPTCQPVGPRPVSQT